MEWDVRFDPAFAAEAAAFTRAVQLEIAALAGLLQRFGPQLRRPYCDTLNGSRYANMKELRFTLADGEWRIAFAFDPERRAILLVGGCTVHGAPEKRAVKRRRQNMTVTIEEFTKNFTPEERAKVAARMGELIEEELTLRDLRQAQNLTQERMAELQTS
jgi:hypothetical protein